MYQVLRDINFTKIKFNFSYIVAFLFIVNSGFHLKDVPTYFTMYLTFYIAIIYLFIISLKKIYLEKSLSVYICIIFVFYLLVSQLLLEGDIIVTLASIITFLFYLIARLLLKKCSIKDAMIISDCTIIYNLILFFIDVIYRFSLAGLNILANFYVAKVNSLLHADSNATAINTTILTFYSYYLFSNFKSKKYLIYTYLCVCFTILTLSRSAIIATIFSFIMIYLHRMIMRFFSQKSNNTNPYKMTVENLTLIIFSIVFLIFVIWSISFITIFLLKDNSFITKINILGYISDFLQNMELNNILFGIGYDNTIKVFHIYAHTYLATYIIETGLIGYVLITSFLCSNLLEYKKTIYLILPFFFLGFSYIGHTVLNLFYVLLACICFFEHKKLSLKRGDC